MEVITLITVISSILFLLCMLFLLKQRQTTKDNNVPPQVGGPEVGRPRRVAAAARNQRARLRIAGPQDQNSEDENEVEGPKLDIPDNVGAKKRAKLEAKAEKKVQREAELQAREDRKRRQELEEAERHKAEEMAEKEKALQEEDERKAREEKERQEHEEYLKMKACFSVEEEGFEEGGDSTEDNLLTEFINYIMKMKVVVLEDLAATFKLKTQNVIDRIQELQEDGTLTGVIDDRGKFIYISEDELAAVAKFVKQRGRVSISDIAESSNQLINLNPDTSVALRT